MEIQLGHHKRRESGHLLGGRSRPCLRALALRRDGIRLVSLHGSRGVSPQTGDPAETTWQAQELYYDNAASLGIKYDLVNSKTSEGQACGRWLRLG